MTLRPNPVCYSHYPQAGFVDVRWGRQVDVFSGSKHESDAKDFDTRGVTFAGIKPVGVASP